MLAPRPHPHSRRRHSPTSAPASLLTSSPPTSVPDFRWSDTEAETETERMAGPSGSSATASTRTSVSNWSDDKTEIPQGPEGQAVKEGRLIDFDDDDNNHQEEEDLPNPTQKLRELLREMEKQAREAVPPPQTTGERRRTFLERTDVHAQGKDTDDSDSSDSSIHRGQQGEGNHQHEEEEEEEQSPPTPPPRIGNPYSGRRVSVERRSPSLAQPGRLPSRAAVLLHSTSRSSPQAPEATQAPSPPVMTTPLQAFLASHSEPSSSTTSRLNLSRTSSTSTTSSSRKGKERAMSPVHDVAETSASRRNRFRLQHQQYQQTLQHQSPKDEVDRPAYPDEVQPISTRERGVDSPPVRTSSVQPAASSNRRRAGTPRRISVDLAPDDSASFVRGLAGGGDVQMEMELDLDEGLSGVGWEENSTIASGSAVSPMEEQHQIAREGYMDDRTAKRTALLRRSVSPQLPTPPSNVSARYSQPQESQSQENRSNSQSRPRSRETSRQEDQLSTSYPYSTSRSKSRNSPSQTFHSARSIEEERDRTPPLPTLPEPDSSTDDQDHEHDTYASRRAALFRSSSKSASASTSTSRGSTNTPSFRTAKNQEESTILPLRRYSPAAPNSVTPSPAKISPSLELENTGLRLSGPRYARDIHIPPQDPIQVGFATSNTKLSTPISQKVPSLHKPNPDVSMSMPTPRPPGAWGTPLHGAQKSKVRFSPLRQEVLNQAQEVEWEEGHSIHRLRMSPRKSPKKGSPSSVKEEEVDAPIDPDTSWTARLSRSLSKARITIPARSTTLSAAQTKLDEAAQTTIEAQAKLELTQRQWLEALTRAGEIGVGSVRRGWNMGYWAWWMLMEVVLLWGVFRVTVDYATSTSYITSFDPFHPLSTPIGHQYTAGGGLLSVGLPVPAGMSTFVNKSGVGSGNFFDLLEAWGVWTLGAGAGAGAAGGGMRMLGGVPS